MTPPTPQKYLELGLKGETPGLIADLQSLLGDIQFARACASSYVQRIESDAPPGPDDDLIKRALWTACAISYRRVFTKGKGHLHPQKPRTRPNDNFTAGTHTGAIGGPQQSPRDGGQAHCSSRR